MSDDDAPAAPEVPAQNGDDLDAVLTALEAEFPPWWDLPRQRAS